RPVFVTYKGGFPSLTCGNTSLGFHCFSPVRLADGWIADFLRTRSLRAPYHANWLRATGVLSTLAWQCSKGFIGLKCSKTRVTWRLEMRSGSTTTSLWARNRVLMVCDDGVGVAGDAGCWTGARDVTRPSRGRNAWTITMMEV